MLYQQIQRAMYLFIVMPVSFYRSLITIDIDCLSLARSGVSRSGTIACMWLMRHHCLPSRTAMERLCRARTCVCPNESFSAQLDLFERMNTRLDVHHVLYKQFQCERARLIYIDHDIDKYGIDEKTRLRQEFRHTVTRAYEYGTRTVTRRYRCRQCHIELFTDADLTMHWQGSGLYNWFRKYNYSNVDRLSSPVECEQGLFTVYLEWFMDQIDVSSNVHSGSIVCRSCSSIVGHFNLNGSKCTCQRWVEPAVYFYRQHIEHEIVKENIDEHE
jgi:hypothetical protein